MEENKEVSTRDWEKEFDEISPPVKIWAKRKTLSDILSHLKEKLKKL